MSSLKARQITSRSDLARQFTAVGDVFLAPTAPDRTDIGWHIPRTFGLAAGIFGLTGLAALVKRRRYALALVLTAAVGASVFLLVEASDGVWLGVPFLRQMRFPWRVFRIGVIFLSLMGGASVWLASSRFRHWSAAAALALVIVAAAPTLYPSPLTKDYSGLTASDAIRYEAASGALGQHEL